jgi:hypothetical protein
MRNSPNLLLDTTCRIWYNGIRKEETMEETTGQRFARMIAERKGISVEEHLRRIKEEQETRQTIQEEEGLEEEEEG